MEIMSNMMNWDPVAWMSVLMVIIAVIIFVYLVVKVKTLMNRDEAAHKNQ